MSNNVSTISMKDENENISNPGSEELSYDPTSSTPNSSSTTPEYTDDSSNAKSKEAVLTPSTSTIKSGTGEETEIYNTGGGGKRTGRERRQRSGSGGSSSFLSSSFALDVMRRSRRGDSSRGSFSSARSDEIWLNDWSQHSGGSQVSYLSYTSIQSRRNQQQQQQPSQMQTQKPTQLPMLSRQKSSSSWASLDDSSSNRRKTKQYSPSVQPEQESHPQGQPQAHATPDIFCSNRSLFDSNGNATSTLAPPEGDKTKSNSGLAYDSLSDVSDEEFDDDCNKKARPKGRLRKSSSDEGKHQKQHIEDTQDKQLDSRKNDGTISRAKKQSITNATLDNPCLKTVQDPNIEYKQTKTMEQQYSYADPYNNMDYYRAEPYDSLSSNPYNNYAAHKGYGSHSYSTYPNSSRGMPSHHNPGEPSTPNYRRAHYPQNYYAHETQLNDPDYLQYYDQHYNQHYNQDTNYGSDGYFLDPNTTTNNDDSSRYWPRHRLPPHYHPNQDTTFPAAYNQYQRSRKYLDDNSNSFENFSGSYEYDHDFSFHASHYSYIRQQTYDSAKARSNFAEMTQAQAAVQQIQTQSDTESKSQNMPNGSKSSSSSKPKVNFTTISLRLYDRILGDNPSCSSGPSLSIGWEYTTELQDYPIDVYEQYRCYQRRLGHEMVISRSNREFILLSLGYNKNEIASAVRANIKTKNQRRRTIHNLSIAGVEETVEMVRRKLSSVVKLNVLNKKKKKERTNDVIDQSSRTHEESSLCRSDSAASSGSSLASKENGSEENNGNSDKIETDNIASNKNTKKSEPVESIEYNGGRSASITEATKNEIFFPKLQETLSKEEK